MKQQLEYVFTKRGKATDISVLIREQILNEKCMITDKDFELAISMQKCAKYPNLIQVLI